MATSLGLVGCGGARLCARTSECRRGAVCGLAGQCTRLRPPPDARFASSRWLHPTDWGVAGARGPLTDALPLGGASEGLFAFGPMPDSSRVLRALLVLHPHESGPWVSERAEIVVEHVGAFRGGPLPARHATQPTAFAAARRALPAGPNRVVRLDVTSAARSSGASLLYLLVRLEGEAAVTVSSPWTDAPERRPRLELMVR